MNKQIKILTFLTLSLFFNITIQADLDFTENSSYLGNYSKILITNRGLIAGQYALNEYFNGIKLSKNIDLNFENKILGGHKITDLHAKDGYIYATTYMNYQDGPGLFKIPENFSKSERLGKKMFLNVVHAFKDKIYTGGNNYGAWVVNQDGTNHIQLLGTGEYGPMIDQIDSNSKNVYILSRGSLYKVDYETNKLTLLLPGYRPSKISVTEDEILAIAGNRFIKLDLDGKLKSEKSFNNNLIIIKKYQKYIFLIENSSTYQKIWISNDLGKNFYESKSRILYGEVLRNMELTGTEEITVFFNFANSKIIKGKFTFDFEEKKFLGLPFKTKNPNDLVDKITSFFDHRYPYLGNKSEPFEFSTTTLNFYGDELEKPYLYYSSHDGIDFGLKMYSEILSAEEGLATYFYQPGGLGHAFLISHPNNYLTIYGHLDEKDLITKEKVYVKKGEVIGKVGMSGNTNGPHLHFTVYHGAKELGNKVDPFGWEGNFEDPWSKKSNYLWDMKPNSLSQYLNLDVEKNISSPYFNLRINQVSDNNTYHLSFYPIAPVLNKANFKYKEQTSYKLSLKNLLNEKVIGFAKISYKGFSNPYDEKRFSIYRWDGKNLIRLETEFDSGKNILSASTSIDSQIMVLESNIKKISTKSKFKVN